METRRRRRAHRRDQPDRGPPRPPQPQDRRLLGQRPVTDGTLTWTTATGRTYTTYPYIYDHPDDQPVKTSTLETIHGHRLAKVLNPHIPLPGHLNIFDQINWAHALTPHTHNPNTPWPWQEPATTNPQPHPTPTPTPTTRHHRSEACDGNSG